MSDRVGSQDPLWRKSSHSDGHGGSCVETAPIPGAVGVRDSKDPGRGRLEIAGRAWIELLTGLKEE